MAQVGRLGSIRFVTSDSRILTFDKFRRKKTARTSEHNVMTGKPKLEWVGAGLDTVTFTIMLMAELGVRPRTEAEKLEYKLENHVVDYLVIGNRKVGDNRWIITDLSEEWDYIYRRGEVSKISLDISLKEYV